MGKGSKERVVPVGSAARKAHRALARAARIAGRRRTRTRCSSARAGERISARTIERRLAAWAVKQGLDRHVHPHMLRHSFASHVLQSSGDLRAVQEMLGHASIARTQVYTHLDFQALAKVYDAAHPRAKRKKHTWIRGSGSSRAHPQRACDDPGQVRQVGRRRCRGPACFSSVVTWPR